MILFLNCSVANAAEQAYLREDIRKTSDSKVSARNNAFKLIRSDPVKEIAELERTLTMQPETEPFHDTNRNSAQVSSPQPMPAINTSADYSRYMRAERLAHVLALLQPLKITVSQYHSEYGEWPSSLEQIDLESGQFGDSQDIDRIRLGDNGRIIAFLSAVFGRDRVLTLEPKSAMGGMHTRWHCVTNLNMKTYQGLGNLECAQQQHIRAY